MTKEELVAADDAFFKALVDANVDALEGLLADDFIIVDVMRGTEVDRSDFLAPIANQQLKFEKIEPAERRIRNYGGMSIINGRTIMKGEFSAAPFGVASRYTHVFLRTDSGVWQLVSAQGTPIHE
jgi:ketosteroid isomerase-like protein